MQQEEAWLMPLLSVRGGAEAVDFYKQAFGADELSRITAPDGHVVARLTVGRSAFMVSDESPEYGNHSPKGLGGTTVRLALVVADPDAALAQAVRAGARAVYPVADQVYGWRLGCVEDPFGHRWDIGRPL